MVMRLIFFSVLFFSFSTRAQTEFIRIYTDVGFEKGEGIAQLSDSSYLLTGSSTSFDVGPPKAFIMQIDSLGNRLWSKPYGGTEVNEGKRIFAIEGYAYYVVGNTNSNSNSDHNFYFLKTDESGNQLIEKQTGTNQWDFVHDAILLSDSTIIATGETYNPVDGLEDQYTVRFDRNGDTLWTLQSHKIGKDKINAIENIGDTAFILAGTVWNDVDSCQSAYLALRSLDGSVIWENNFGRDGSQEIKDVELWNNVLHCVGNRVIILDSLRDEYAIRVDLLQGDSLSGYSYIGNSDKSMSKILKTSQSNKFYIATSFIDQYSYGEGEDFFIAGYDDYLSYEYTGIQFKNSGQEDIGDFIKTNDGGAIMIGTNSSFGTENANVFVLKIGVNDVYPDPLATPVINTLVQVEENELLHSDAEIQLYPNPTSGVFYIKLNDYYKGNMLVKNNLGQVVRDVEFEGDTISANISELSSGVYFLSIKTGDGSGNKHYKLTKN